MPPRVVKRGGSAGKKTPARAARGAKAAAAAAAAAEEAAREEELVKVEEVTVATLVETKEVVKVEEKKSQEAVANGSAAAQDEEDLNEPFEEEDRAERLELEDNEPGYEEETAVDYDEQDMEHADDGQEMEGDEAEYVEEGDMVEEEEAEMAEEVEDEGEEAEGEEDVEDREEEHEVDGEEDEHHEVVKEHRKRKEFEVFVGGLDKDATEDDLRKVFSVVGEITEVRLMMNPQTKKNKGFAFLRYATVEQAKRAVSELKTPIVHGKQCGVAPSQDSDTLFVGNICKTWTKEHLKEKLKNFGVESIEDLTLVEDTNNDGMNRGFAFLEFSSRTEAMEAFRRLQKRDVFLGTDRNVKVSFADSFIDPDDEIMAQVTTVFIDGLPAAWDEDRVKSYLKKYGQIEKIELARNMPSAKRKDFGFVTFGSHDNAVACAEGINNKELGEGDNKVKVRARLSRPHQKGRGKRGIRGELRIGRGPLRGGPVPHSRPPPPRRYLERSTRPISGPRVPLGGRGYKRPIPYREMRPYSAIPERPRRMPPPPERHYERRPPPVPVYPKSSSKREYSRRNEPPPRGRPVADYPSRLPVERHSAYRDEYSARGSGYADVPLRSAPRVSDRRAYPEEGYGRKLERAPTYRDGHSRDYDSLSGSKRSYSELDDVPPRYADVSMRQSRPRVEYGVSGGSAQYDDAYADSRIGRSHAGYGSSRSSLSSHDGMYNSRQGMSYGGGSVRGSDDGGMYSANYSGSYLPRGSDVGGSSYSSVYSGRSLGGGYMGGSSSGSYY